MADYDVIVVGGGMAALSAALVAARSGHSCLVLAPALPGGQITNVSTIEDFPGFIDGVSGYELGPNTQLQAMNNGAEFEVAEVQRLTLIDGGWHVLTTDGEYRGKTVIVAAGSRSRKLSVPGLERLEGRGVGYCASCDGPLYRGQIVGVVGGGDSAISEALALAAHVGQVIVFHRRHTYTAQATYLQRAREHPRIAFHPGVIVTEILGEEAVCGVRVREVATEKHSDVPVSALFVYIGCEPNTHFLRDVLTLNGGGRIPTDIWMRTSEPGLFAAGDIRSDSAGQAITAAGDGATAAIAAHRFLSDRDNDMG